MKIIGLAGRPGSGKSAVARALAAETEVEWIDLDRVAWETYAPGSETFDRVVDRFGEEIVDADGEIDRGELAIRIFLDSEAKADLEAIVHPAVLDHLLRFAEAHRVGGTKILLVEGALLSSSPHVNPTTFDAILWLDAPDDVRAERLRVAGRADHAARGDNMAPGLGAVVIDAVGTVADVADRIREQIADL